MLALCLAPSAQHTYTRLWSDQPDMNRLNFYENELMPCSSNGMAMTGATSDGYCTQ